MKMPAYLTLATVILLPILFGFTSIYQKSKSSKGIIVKLKPIPNSKSVILWTYNLQQQPTTISIKNQSEQIIYTRHFSGRNGYRELIHLKSMHRGFYYIEINHPSGKRIKRNA